MDVRRSGCDPHETKICIAHRWLFRVRVFLCVDCMLVNDPTTQDTFKKCLEAHLNSDTSVLNRIVQVVDIPLRAIPLFLELRGDRLHVLQVVPQRADLADPAVPRPVPAPHEVPADGLLQQDQAFPTVQYFVLYC